SGPAEFPDQAISLMTTLAAVADFTSVAVAVRIKLPSLPVTVNGYDPSTVVESTVTVSVEEAPVAGLGLKLPMAPVGSPLTERLTPALCPPVRVMFTVYDV